MDINKKNRSDLKHYFVKNSIPTESNFAELIDGMLNQKDDGIVKLSVSDPLSIQAAGDTAKVINFYEDFQKADPNPPAWTLLLKPRTDSANPATATLGFCISDGQGINRFFIDSMTGYVGIGTITPNGKLDIANIVRFGLDEGGSGAKSISFAKDAGDEINAGKITYKGTLGSSLNIVGAGSSSTTRQIKLYDNVEVVGTLKVNAGITGSTLNVTGLTNIAALQVNDTLQVKNGITGGTLNVTGLTNVAALQVNNTLQVKNGITGSTLNVTGLTNVAALQVNDTLQVKNGITGGTLNVTGLTNVAALQVNDTLQVKNGITASSSKLPPTKNAYGVPDAVSGIRFADNPGGGGQDAAWIQYYARSGESCTLEIGVSNDADDHIALMPSGNVGIGTTSPTHKFHVLANEAVGLFESSGTQAYLRLSTKEGIDNRVEITNRPGGRLSLWTAVGGDVFNITKEGNVGIGTIAPTQAKLVVLGSALYTLNGYGYTNRNGASATNTTYTSPYSIFADNRIAAVEFNAFSDERIKNIQGHSDNVTDLQMLLGIEITDYYYKDVIGKGNAPHKKVIAQQLEQVFPQAVSKHTDVVPDIYQRASFIDGWVKLATDLKKGERVRLISDKSEGIYEILEVAQDKFRTDFTPEGDNVFVFGREVNDFGNVDYDAIAMLNVSATQQLKKEIDALKTENTALNVRINALEAKTHL